MPLDNSKILLKISTPYESYKTLYGKMGYKAREKHIFFDIYGDNFKLGVELRYLYKNLSNYNLKLRVNTPVDPLRQLIIAGKLNNELVSTYISPEIHKNIYRLYTLIYFVGYIDVNCLILKSELCT